MADHPIKDLMSISMEKIKEMVDVNTIVGEPITTPDGTTIIPVSKVSFGFASGGSDIPSNSEKQPFGGAGGAGISLQPLAFLIIANGDVKLLPMTTSSDNVNNLVNMVPQVMDRITTLFQKDKTTDLAQTDASLLE